jgi:hypothetical protein
MRSKDGGRLTRRRLLKSAGGVIAAAAAPAGLTSAAARPDRSAAQDASPSTAPAAQASKDITGRLARYMIEARDRALPADVSREARHRILDTLAAMVSGSQLAPGEAAIRYVRSQGGTEEAAVLTTNIRTTAVNAALANAMFAHADETDDFEPVTKAHPGCAVVPAALAVAERDGRSGADVLKAVVLGYDLCCRFLMALGPDHVRGTHRSAEGTSATFGAAAAAAALARLDERGTRFALSYAAQQVSGIWSWARDTEHIEKAFDFAGMGARNGVTAALMVQSGFSGVPDVLDGEHNMIEALSTEPPVLRDRNRDQDVLRRLSNPGAARRPAGAATGARFDPGKRRADRRAPSRRWCLDRRQPGDARRQSSVRARGWSGRRHDFIRRQSLAGADEGSAGPGDQRPRGARCRPIAARSRGAAQRQGGGHAA